MKVDTDNFDGSNEEAIPDTERCDMEIEPEPHSDTIPINRFPIQQLVRLR